MELCFLISVGTLQYWHNYSIKIQGQSSLSNLVSQDTVRYPNQNEIDK